MGLMFVVSITVIDKLIIFLSLQKIRGVEFSQPELSASLAQLVEQLIRN
jgi:hypothetical protein